MRKHTLEATGGKTYAQMPRFASADGKGTNDEKGGPEEPEERHAGRQPRAEHLDHRDRAHDRPQHRLLRGEHGHLRDRDGHRDAPLGDRVPGAHAPGAARAQRRQGEPAPPPGGRRAALSARAQRSADRPPPATAGGLLRSTGALRHGKHCGPRSEEPRMADGCDGRILALRLLDVHRADPRLRRRHRRRALHPHPGGVPRRGRARRERRSRLRPEPHHPALPNATGDIGNWTESLGLASLFVDAAMGIGAYLTLTGRPALVLVDPAKNPSYRSSRHTAAEANPQSCPLAVPQPPSDAAVEPKRSGIMIRASPPTEPPNSALRRDLGHARIDRPPDACVPPRVPGIGSASERQVAPPVAWDCIRNDAE